MPNRTRSYWEKAVAHLQADRALHDFQASLPDSETLTEQETVRIKELLEDARLKHAAWHQALTELAQSEPARDEVAPED